MAFDCRAAAAQRGPFITIEGGEGAGKSTHCRILGEALARAGVETAVLREPGGTVMGEALRALLLDPANDPVDPRCELLLYEAARAQLVSQVIVPALVRGEAVICDRFTDSTAAYQGAGRGLDEGFIAEANDFAASGLAPDRTVVLAVTDAAGGLARAIAGHDADRLEQAGEQFHRRVNEAFVDAALANPDRIRLVDSTGSVEKTAAEVYAALEDILSPLGVTCEAYGKAARAVAAELEAAGALAPEDAGV